MAAVELHLLLKQVIPKSATVFDHEVMPEFPVVGRRKMLLSAPRIAQPDNGRSVLLSTPPGGEHPYLYLDGIVMKRSWAGEVRNVSLLVARAMNSEGHRDILGIAEGA